MSRARLELATPGCPAGRRLITPRAPHDRRPRGAALPAARPPAGRRTSCCALADPLTLITEAAARPARGSLYSNQRPSRHPSPRRHSYPLRSIGPQRQSGGRHRAGGGLERLRPGSAASAQPGRARGSAPPAPPPAGRALAARTTRTVLLAIRRGGDPLVPAATGAGGRGETLFCAAEQAAPWRRRGLLPRGIPVIEVAESSTDLTPVDHRAARAAPGRAARRPCGGSRTWTPTRTR